MTNTRSEAAGGRSTRERLLEAGLRLFAERGFSAVTVGDIERAVGLVPRRGAMYRHFPSKESLLGAAVENHLTSVATARSRYIERVESRGAAALEIGEFILAEMDRQRLITQVLERDGDRLRELRDRFRRDVSDTGYQTMAEILRWWLERSMPRADRESAEVLAVHLLGALVNVRRSTWTLGAPPLGRSDAQLLAGWARLCEAVSEATE